MTSALIGAKLWDWLRDPRCASSPIVMAQIGSSLAVTQADVDTWQDNNRRVFSYLMLNCQDSALAHARLANTAHEVWKTFTDIYEVKTPGQI
eukprot:c37230_g1_i1 orf=2-274(-)